MLVEDDQELREILSAILSARYEVLTAESPDELINHPGLPEVRGVFTDMNIKDGTGLDVISFMTKSLPNIPVTLISGDSSEDLATQATSLGAVSYLGKPFNSKKLFEEAGRLIEENLNRTVPVALSVT